MKTNKMKRTYTKRQILESIKYWQRQLKTMNESDQEDENFEKRSAYYAKKNVQDISSQLKKLSNEHYAAQIHKMLVDEKSEMFLKPIDDLKAALNQFVKETREYNDPSNPLDMYKEYQMTAIEILNLLNYFTDLINGHHLFDKK